MGYHNAKLNNVLVVWGLILIMLGAVIAVATDFSPLRTLKAIQVDEVSTDWYSTDYSYATKGDTLEISVNVSGGSAKLRVEEQSRGIVFQEVHGVILLYIIPIEFDGAYSVVIWTRAFPWPSNYVNLTGSVTFKRVFNNFYPMGYVAAGTIIAGSLLIVSSVIRYLQEKKKAKDERKLRTCPYCNQKVPIDRSICPHCGFDVSRSVRCKYCNGFYNRSLSKCPNCGAKKG